MPKEKVKLEFSEKDLKELIAEKYNGIMNVNYENQTFEVRILLTLPTTFS